MIYILEGADGVGKSTLANEIARLKKASVIHSYFDPSWDIKNHHQDMMTAARLVSLWRPVVLDRWAHSELIYGAVFRGGPGYDVSNFLLDFQRSVLNNSNLEIVWIFCDNKHAVENHFKNSKKRSEMFDDMSMVVTSFRIMVKLEEEHGIRNWIRYDYDEIDMTEFVKELPGENVVN